MSGGAILMMVVGILIIWGGLGQVSYMQWLNQEIEVINIEKVPEKHGHFLFLA